MRLVAEKCEQIGMAVLSLPAAPVPRQQNRAPVAEQDLRRESGPIRTAAVRKVMDGQELP